MCDSELQPGWSVGELSGGVRVEAKPTFPSSTAFSCFLDLLYGNPVEIQHSLCGRCFKDLCTDETCLFPQTVA